MRISHVALLAGNGNPSREGAAPSDLQHIAKRFARGGFADDAEINFLALLFQPLQYLFRAIDGGAFFVARDKEADGALCWRINCSRDESSNRTLHVAGAAAPDLSVLDCAAEGVARPEVFLAHGNNVCVSRETQMRCIGAATGIKVVDIWRIFV